MIVTFTVPDSIMLILRLAPHRKGRHLVVPLVRLHPDPVIVSLADLVSLVMEMARQFLDVPAVSCEILAVPRGCGDAHRLHRLPPVLPHSPEHWAAPLQHVPVAWE